MLLEFQCVKRIMFVCAPCSWIDFHVDEDQSDDNIEEQKQEEEEEVKRDAKSHVSTPHSNLVWLTIADSPPNQGQETLEAGKTS